MTVSDFLSGTAVSASSNSPDHAVVRSVSSTVLSIALSSSCNPPIVPQHLVQNPDMPLCWWPWERAEASRGPAAHPCPPPPTRPPRVSSVAVTLFPSHFDPTLERTRNLALALLEGPKFGVRWGANLSPRSCTWLLRCLSLREVCCVGYFN